MKSTEKSAQPARADGLLRLSRKIRGWVSVNTQPHVPRVAIEYASCLRTRRVDAAADLDGWFQ